MSGKIFISGGLREYNNYEPHLQGATRTLFVVTEEPKKGDYGVFNGAWNTPEVRPLEFTKNNKLNGAQKRHAHYFLRKVGEKSFPKKSEVK